MVDEAMAVALVQTKQVAPNAEEGNKIILKVVLLDIVNIANSIKTQPFNTCSLNSLSDKMRRVCEELLSH